MEPIPGLTTMNHFVPEGRAIPLPTRTRLVLRVSDGGSDGRATTYMWIGAREIEDAGGVSRAVFQRPRAGSYTPRVVPVVRGRALPPIAIPVQVIAVASDQIQLTIAEPASEFATFIHNPFKCRAVTAPPEFAELVEWDAPSATPERSFGASFVASRRVVGALPIHARLGARQASVGTMVYAAHWVRTPKPEEYFYAPTVRLHREIRTDPPGYEDRVRWSVTTLGTADAEPAIGVGRVFVVAMTRYWDTYVCSVVHADNLVESVDIPAPPSCTNTLQLCDQRPAQPDRLGVGEPVATQSAGPPDQTVRPRYDTVTEDLGCACEGPPNDSTIPLPCCASGSGSSLPIGLSNGEARLAQVDLYVPSRGFPFVWGRTYSSRASFDGPIGQSWDLTYHRRLVVLVGGDVSLVTGLAREDVYVSVGGGGFISPPGFFDQLVKNGDGTYTQTTPHGIVYRYDTSGFLVSIADRNGNTLTITRNGFHNVTLITDTQGREYTVAYTDGTAAQKIQSLTDFSGRQIVYTYSAANDLIRVRSPLVTGTPNGNDFPLGKTTLYTYSSGSIDPRLNHNLLSAIEPAYNVANDPAQSKPWATLTYASTLDPSAADYDRVISERWGHDAGGPPSNPNVVVGGTSTYAYVRGLGWDPEAPPDAASSTTLTDRNGNVLVHYFDASRHLVKLVERTNRNVRPGEGDYTTNYTYSSEGLLTSRANARGNAVTYAYDSTNLARRSQGNLLEVREKANGIGGGGVDLVTRFTYEPLYNQMRTRTDPRAFPAGSVPVNASGRLDLANPSVARYTTTHYFDYQETACCQGGVVAADKIPENLGDLNGAADFAEGNLIKIEYPVIQTAGPNLNQTAAALMTYSDRGQALTRKDPEGHTTTLEYFPASGAPNDPSDREGYLKSVTKDTGGFNLKTQFGRDTRGNVTSITDPKGQVTDLDVNALNQVVRARSRVVFGATRYRVDTFYDANDHVVRLETQNFDENGALYAHNPLADTFEFNILGLPVAEIKDKSANDNSTTGTVRLEYYYDANLNRTAVKLPLAVTGAVPSNVVTTRYDERDLVYKTTQGDNDLDPANAPPAGASVITTNYDANENEIETIDVIRNAQHANAPVTVFPGSAAGDVTKTIFDGFDREVKSIDAEGNEEATSYDLASNPTQTTLTGVVDHTASAAFVLLAQSNITYDERRRIVRLDDRHFAPKTGLDIGDGHEITQFTYDRDSKVTAATDDHGNVTTKQWDTADREIKTIDPLLNEVEFGYDANDNVTTVTRRDISTDLATATQLFTTTRSFDGLDRLIKTVDNAGDVNELFYDSRSNVVKTSDALRGAGQPSGPGNIVRRTFDGLERLTRTDYAMTTNGRGDGAPAGTITTRQAWDDDSRLIEQRDDKNQTTTYGYDTQNRLISVTYADTFGRVAQYDADHQRTQVTDPNGSVATTTFDGLGRPLSRTVVRGAGVQGSTAETFGYDGSSRVTFAQNDDGISAGTVDCLLEYDSFDNRTKEQQGAFAVDSTFDELSNRTAVTYPGKFGGGRRTLTHAFDALDRLQSIAEGAARLSTYHYKGPSRIERRTYGTDATPFSKLDLLYDAAERVIDLSHTAGGGGAIAGFQYGYDRMHHRLFEKRTHDAGQGDVNRYDSTYRLIRGARAVDLSAFAPGSAIDPDAYASHPNRAEYNFDGVGNRATKLDVASSIPVTTTYGANAVNAYTSIQVGAAGATPYTYDKNGNLTNDGVKKYEYDFKNRLFAVRNASDNALIVRYAYDALDRRKRKVFAAGGETRFLYDGQRLVEERDGADVLQRQFVWGNQTDELLEQKTATATWYAHENSIGSIAALSNSAGTALERYVYDPFGATTVTLDGATGNPIRFHGAYFDPETGFYHMRARAYSPTLGRFVQRDPIGFWGDGENAGNPYTIVGNDPVDDVDSTGEGPEWHHMVPQEILDRLKKLGIDIEIFHSSEFGWYLDKADHECLHSAGWNKEWKTWLDELEKKGKKVSVDDVRSRMKELKKAKAFKQILAKGFKAKFGFHEAARKTEAIRKKLAEKLKAIAKKGAGLGAKKGGKKIPIVGILVSAWFFLETASEHGVCYAAGDALLDAVPGVGLVKGVVEGGILVKELLDEEAAAEAEAEKELKESLTESGEKELGPPQP
jgi:RHS repeat-associated protein